MKANTSYTIEVIAENVAGVTQKEISFVSGQLMKQIGLRKAEEVKLDEAKLTAWIILIK